VSVPAAYLTAGSVRAHPVTGHPHVDVPVLAVGVGAAALVVLVLLATPRRSDPPVDDPESAASWTGSLTATQVVARVVAALALGLAVAAGLFGVRNELENIAPALVVGAAWPLLTLASLVGPVWRWVDPWDAAARALVPGDTSEPPGHVWPAVGAAAALAWYAGVHSRPLDPRAVGMLLLGYTTLTLLGCLLLGRRRWLSSAEPVGILLAWVTTAGRARLGEPARGAVTLVGVSLGGLLFAVLRRTGWWTDLEPLPQSTLDETAGLLLCCALGAALLAAGAAVGHRLRDRGAVLCGAVPLLVGIVMVLSLERNRLFTSIQLLPGLLGDPFGAGWDLLGPAGRGLDPDPLGAAGLIVAQLAAVGLTSSWGAVSAGRRSPRASRVAAATVLGYAALVAAVAVALH
jgi:hypothetical protein